MFKNLFSQKPQPTLDVERALRFATNRTAQDFRQALDRSSPRRAVWAQAVLRFPSGHSIEGILVDYSESGAKIRFRSRQPVPRFATLIAAGVGLSRSVEVAWTSDFDVGCRFIDELDAPVEIRS